MYRTLLGLSLLLAVPAFAQRHYVVEPEHVLSDTEKSELAARGIEVQQALSAGRYLVRVAPGASIDGDRVIRSASPLTPQKKIERTALRAAASGKPFIDVNVFFFNDVGLDAAKEAIETVGGTTSDPFQVGFGIHRLISGRIPSTSLSDLASDERVMLVYGPRRLRPTLGNANAAALANVTAVQSAPYGLTGQGVSVSSWEFGAPDVTHVEFGGRVESTLPPGTTTSPFGCGDAVTHATHTTGTMVASGIDARAKGMAPNASLRGYDANQPGEDGFADLLVRKGQLNSTPSLADNNSWGYILGWCHAPDCTGFEWTDTSEYYGAYDAFYVAGLDKVARASTALMMHSAGNDAGNRGPQFEPYAHSHEDAMGNTIPNRTYCYSSNGSGTDCPAPTCTAGFCETVRHPEITSQLPAPWISLGLTAAAKNVLSVGAVDQGLGITSFSSRGPARDGRVKPDVVALGSSVYSTYPRNAYGNCSGTSMSTPVVTGAAALMAEQWRRTFRTDPAPVALKTLLIAGARDLGNPGPDYSYGFGLVDAKATADLIIGDAAQGRRIRIDSVSQGSTFEVPAFLSLPGTLRVVLGWSDPEVIIFPDDDFATSALVNDLDVKVIRPDGSTELPYVLDKDAPEKSATRGVNSIDNSEMVEIPGAAPGNYRIVVTGTRIADSSPQQFVLVSNGDIGVVAPPCTDSNEPNNSEATAFGFLTSQQTTTGRMCEAGDVDFYKFTVDRPGPVSVTVVSADTPLRVTLSSSATAPVTVDVAAGGSQTLTTQYAGSTPAIFFVRVEPIGAIGGTTSYTVTPTFSHAAGKHRRAVRR